MSVQQSLDLVQAEQQHYYTCILYNIPNDLPVSEIGPHVVADPNSERVKQLLTSGSRIVPHQLHVFKEPLDTKFGYVSFFLNLKTQGVADEATIHRLMLEWIENDLKAQLQLVKTSVKLGQPPECYSSIPFLLALNRYAAILDPGKCIATKRIETFLLWKMEFSKKGLNTKFNKKSNDKRTATDVEGKEELQEEKKYDEGHNPLELHDWASVGTIAASSIGGREFAWLKREIKTFPPLLVTNNDFKNATVDKDKLLTFLQEGLKPLIAVTE